ncbi:ABC transporter permease [Microbacterium sorbitolivorans]|uniref:ABC transporter permease n=1 Tax=Microbacterium sorbitolivorans TaxID=1867410 RepID=A0A367Y337_9MICO|nr:ABC transporter permease [Microbacterium sorbitolivorans]RCK60019.1 ABC transporter permease [Microbacterium sorbitolivorans]GGF42048.1 ABC transporter permease [Microbacterium sorbitolivorans]
MTWLSQNWPQVLSLIGEHLALSLPAIALSILIAVPLGRFAQRRPRLGGSLTSAAALLYAIPALPMLIVIPVLLGVPLRSSTNMIITLAVYGTALLVRSVVDGFRSVDTSVRESATAIGYSPIGMFWRVDLPLALPVILAGVRVVTVSTISLATIGALVGISNLGSLLTDGFQRGITSEVATGILVTAALALALDGLLLLTGRVLAPWRRARA